MAMVTSSGVMLFVLTLIQICSTKMALKVGGVSSNKVLHPTAYSFSRSSLRFQRLYAYPGLGGKAITSSLRSSLDEPF
jgi:hypothetical protein